MTTIDIINIILAIILIPAFIYVTIQFYKTAYQTLKIQKIINNFQELNKTINESKTKE